MDFENRKLIEANLPALLQLTSCNVTLLAILRSQEVLSTEEQQGILSEPVDVIKANKLYGILPTRKGAFTALLDALKKTKQTGALEILKAPGEATIPKQMKISRFLGTPQFLIDYLNSERKQTLLIQSDDCQLTLDRITETVPNAKFYEPDTFLEAISCTEISFQNSNSLLVIDCRNGLKSCLRHAAKVKWHTAMICQSAEKIPDNNNILIRKDILKWDDLSPLFQSKLECKCLDLIGLQLQEFLDIQQSLSHDDILKLISGKTPSMFCDHLPEQISYYIDRSLVTRYILTDHIFSHNGRDIFFIHGIERPELSERVKGKSTETSSEILSSAPTSNFVVLEHEHHFETISRRYTTIPMHYIIYRDEQFTWHRSSGGLHTIQQYIHSGQVKVDEHDLLENMCEEINQNKTIGISDAPGMGKTILLANIARKLKTRAKSWQSFFVIVSEVFHKYLELKNIHDSEERVLNSFESCLCVSELGKAVFCGNKLNVRDIFLDGLDELTAENIVDAYEFIGIIRSVFKNSRIWVTTRPHLAMSMEKALNILVYNIEPFSEDNQINFFKSFWSRNCLSLDAAQKCEIFAKCCLKSIKATIDSNNEQDIAGIPLQCLLIGEVFEDDANEVLNRNEEQPPYVEITSISELYEKLVAKKITKYFERYDKRKIDDLDIIKAHIDLSLLLLFPTFRKKNGKCLSAHGLNVQEIFDVGLLESKSVLPVPRFIHRTFAEFFVAKFIKMSLEANIDFIFELLFKQILKTLKAVSKNCRVKFETRQFKHGVICFFIDSFISHNSFEINWNAYSKKFYEKLPQNTILQILDACVYSSNENLLFKVVCKLPHFPDFTSNVFNDRLLFISTLNSKKSMLEKVLVKFLSVNTNNASLSNISVQDCTLLHIAAARGNYSIFEQIANLQGFLALLSTNDGFTMNIVHDCVKHTKNENTQTINEKITIVKFLSKLNQNWVKEISVPTLLSERYPNTHVIFLIEMLELAEAIQTETSENLQNFLHAAAQKYKADEYHKLLVYIKTKYSPEFCHVLFNSSIDGISLLARILRDIKLDNSMLQFIIAHDFQIFNEKDKNYNPILVAIKKNHEVSFIKWLRRKTPSSQVQLTYELCRKKWFKSHPSTYRYLILDELKDEISTLENVFVKWSWLVRFTEIKDSTFEELASVCVNEISDINAINQDGDTLMHLAAKNLNLRAVMFLYEKGGSVALENQIRHTPSDAAAAKVNEKELNKLLEENSGISHVERLEKFILFASRNLNWQDVKFFCGWYARILKQPVASIKTEIGGKVWTILDVVRKFGGLRMIEYFVTNHAFIEAYRASNQTSILFDCVKIGCNSYGDIDSLKQIIKLHGDTVNSPDENGIVPLSTKGVKSTSIRLLLEAGADVNLVDSEGNTPLHSALKHDQDDVDGVVEVLIECGADVNAENVDHETPLRLALNLTHSRYTVECVKALIKANADIRRRDSFGDTFLHILPSKLKSDDWYLKEEQFHQILECVLEKGDSDALSLVGKDNLNSIQLASQHFQLFPRTLEILKKYQIFPLSST